MILYFKNIFIRVFINYFDLNSLCKTFGHIKTNSLVNGQGSLESSFFCLVDNINYILLSIRITSLDQSPYLIHSLL